jgi:hypothetical protein
VFQRGDHLLGGRYRIEDLAGEKKSCIVFKANAVAGGAPVAVRVLAPFVLRQPHVVSRLRSRAEFAMGMDHPNLTQVVELGDEAGAFVIVESWHEALPLLRVVRGKGACSPYEAAWLAARLARGVDHLISCGAPGFDFTLSDVYADIGDLRRETEFFSMPVHQWPGLAVRLSPLALDGDGFSERALATPTDSAQPLVRSVARIIFNLVTGGMGDPLSEPVLSEKFTASLRDCLTGARQAGTCRELLWTLFGDFGPEISALLPSAAEAKVAADGEVGSLLEDLDRQGEELEALLRYKSFGKQIKKQLAVLEEQRAGVMEQQRRMREDGERLQALEDRLRAERDQLASQRDELGRRGSELAEKERAADEAARARAAELRERELELEALHAEQERERTQVRAELERLRVSQEGLAHEKQALSDRVARYEKEQQELAASREALEAGRRKLDAERDEIEGRVAEFKRLKSELEQSGRELEEQRQALARRQTEIETKGVGLSSVERELSERLAAEQRELVAKIEAVQAKNRALDEREEALRTKEASLASTNQALAREEEVLAGRLGEVDAKLAEERHRLTDKEREIQAREEALAAQEREWQAKLERQRAVQDEKESLVEELRGKLAGVSGELEAVTAEKQRLEAEQSRIAASQEALGERSDSIGRERLDLKAVEEKLRREIQEESESRSRENKALERRIVRYRRIVRFGVPVAAALILGLGVLLLAKPAFPDSAADVRNLPEWKQEWLRRDLAKEIDGKIAAGEWRGALGSLHYHALGFSRRPDDVMEAARRTCGELAKEWQAGPEAFETTFRDHEGQRVPISPALGELASWGIPDAERIHLHLDAREALRQAQEERSLGARAKALRAIVELKRHYPDLVTWKTAVAPVLTPLVAGSIGEAMALLAPGNSGRDLSKGFREVFSSEQVIEDLRQLEDAGIREAAALRVAAEALAEMTRSELPDAVALAGFLADRVAEDWPVEVRAKLVEVLVAHVGSFRDRLKEGGGSFVDALESRDKPADLVRLAGKLWARLRGDYPTGWFSGRQLGELYGFVGDVLTDHRAVPVNVHEAYQTAAEQGDKESAYWTGRGHVGAAVDERPGEGEPDLEVTRAEDFAKGVALLEAASASKERQVRLESLWLLSEMHLRVGRLREASGFSRQAWDTAPVLKSAKLNLQILLALHGEAPDPALLEELSQRAVAAAAMVREAPEAELAEAAAKATAEGVLELSFQAFSRRVEEAGEPPAALLAELARQFDLRGPQDRFAGLRYSHRANWKGARRPPFEGLSEDEGRRRYVEDTWESANLGFAAARAVAEKIGLRWDLDKAAAVSEWLGE